MKEWLLLKEEEGGRKKEGKRVGELRTLLQAEASVDDWLTGSAGSLSLLG